MSTDETHDADELLAAAYALEGPDANRALYARWATTYESGFIAESGYVYHLEVAKVLARATVDRVTATDVIVDIGCGTGLAGAAVRQLLDVDLDGIDISPEMLAQASAKRHGSTPVYRALIEADLTQRLAIADSLYAGAISVGTFTHGHVGPGALSEVVRIVRPGGVVVVGVNAAHFAEHDFAATLAELDASGRIVGLRFVDVAIYADADLRVADNVGRVAVFSVAEG